MLERHLENRIASSGNEPFLHFPLPRRLFLPAESTANQSADGPRRHISPVPVGSRGQITGPGGSVWYGHRVWRVLGLFRYTCLTTAYEYIGLDDT